MLTDLVHWTHLGHGVNLELAALVAHEKHPEGHCALSSWTGFHVIRLHHLMLVPCQHHWTIAIYCLFSNYFQFRNKQTKVETR